VTRMAIISNLYHERESISKISTALIGLTLAYLINAFEVNENLPTQAEPMTVSLIEPPEEPKPVIEKPVEVVKPKPVENLVAPKVPLKASTIVPTKSPQPKPTAEQVEPEKVMPLVNDTLPVLDSPVSTLENEAIPAVSAVKYEASIPSKFEDVKSSIKSNGESEGGFAQDIKARIERKKEYPENARNLGMTGEVEVLYELDRSGNLLRAEVITSSGHRLLDQAALKAVKSVRYGIFPEDAWIGSGSKEFRTKLVFHLN